MNSIDNPLTITCIGNAFKLSKRLIIEDEQSFEFVDKQVALDLQNKLEAFQQQSFEKYLISNYQWNGASWGDRIQVPHITKSTDTIYWEYMRKFYPTLLETKKQKVYLKKIREKFYCFNTIDGCDYSFNSNTEEGAIEKMKEQVQHMYKNQNIKLIVKSEINLEH